MKKILVTGASGFIGSHLVEKLLKSNNKVKALIKYNFKPTDKKSNRKLLINIINLNYLQSSKYLVKGNIQINCEMQAIAINNKIKYEKIFETQFTKKIVLTPLVTEDDDNINKVISANIDKILADWSILNTIRS